MKKLLLMLLIVLTLLSLCACGETKEPTSDIPSSDSDTLPTFTKESTESIHDGLGNSIANYSNLMGRIVECKDYIFHSYTEDYQIVVTEKSTGFATTLPINGYNLNLYNNVLYYKSPDSDNIYAYDLISGEVYSPVLPQKPKNTFSYYQFFVTEHGFVIVYDELISVKEVCVSDFQGNIVARKNISNSAFRFINEDLLVSLDNNMITTLSLPNLEERSLACPPEFNGLESFGDGYLYDICKSEDKNCIIKLNPLSGEYEKYQIDDSKGYNISYNNGVLYYTSQDGTSMISTSGEPLGVFNSLFHIFDMSFTADGYVYGIAADKTEDTVNVFSKLYVRLRSDGTELTGLHY